jgi:hypothetical protein
MNIRKQNWLINRRHALKGLGVSLALPMFDCMRPLHAKVICKKNSANQECVHLSSQRSKYPGLSNPSAGKGLSIQ